MVEPHNTDLAAGDLSLKSLKLKNFTVFGDAEFQFAPGLNVIVGENGTGKTHILKVAYACAYMTGPLNKLSIPIDAESLVDSLILAEKLKDVFKIDDTDELLRKGCVNATEAEVIVDFGYQQRLEIEVLKSNLIDLSIKRAPEKQLEGKPVYIPTRELLSIYPGFVSLYELSYVPFEGVWRDLCVLLGAPLARKLSEKQRTQLLRPLETSMGGEIVLSDSGRFYLKTGAGQIEMHLVAEGLRKLAMIARLIATGSLADNGYLFWDEPEANLNPKVIKVIARAILNLCQSGVQVFIASHSLFLLREIDILLQSPDYEKVSHRFIGLHPSENGVDVQQGESVDDIGQIDALQEELSQSDRYLEAGND